MEQTLKIARKVFETHLLELLGNIGRDGLLVYAHAKGLLKEEGHGDVEIAVI